MILPGSSTASGLRHGDNASDSARSNPAARAASVNSTPPAWPIADTSATSTWKCGYGPVVFTLKMLFELGEQISRQDQFSQFRSIFHVYNTTTGPPNHESPRLVAIACSLQ